MAFVSVGLKSSVSWISFMGSFQVGEEDSTLNSYDEDKPLGEVFIPKTEK